MARPPDDPSGDPSGVLVYPKAPVPKRRSDPSVHVKGFDHGGGGGSNNRKKLMIGVGAAAVVGGLIGFIAAPSHADEASAAKAQLVTVQKSADAEKARADGASKQLAIAMKDKQDADNKVGELSSKAADVEKKAAELAAVEKKLSGTIDGSQGSVSTEGDEIHLKLVDTVLFAVGDDQLTDKGKAVLDKVAAALKDLPDKQVWVQGHTDDQPIFVPPPKKELANPKDKKKPKDAKPAPAAPSAVRFITNWELSAARALQVVHYLQDVGKIDPTRLAALAFGQYHPVSKTNKARNRRIEIVLYPKPKISAK